VAAWAPYPDTLWLHCHPNQIGGSRMVIAAPRLTRPPLYLCIFVFILGKKSASTL